MEAPRVDNELHRRGLPVRALLHLILIELTEKMTDFTIRTNLMSSFTAAMDVKKAANFTNFWGGAVGVALLVGALVDHTFNNKRFTNITIYLLAYITGLCMLTIAGFIPDLIPMLKPLFFISIGVIGIVSGGLRSSIESLTDSQYDDHNDHLKTKWKLGVSSANFLGTLGISYAIGLVGWGFTSLILLVLMIIGTGLYCCGKSLYQVRMPTQNPNSPENPNPHQNPNLPQNPNSPENPNPHQNPNLPQNPNPPFRSNLCMLILCWYTSCIVFGFYSAQIPTLFVLQNDIMDRFVHGTELPPALFVCLSTTAVQPIVFLLGKFVFPISGRTTNRERDNNFLKRTEIGIVLGLIGTILSGIVERKRITSQRNIGYSELSAFWVLPQGILYATIESLMSEGISEYFEEHWASSLARVFYVSAVGFGSWINILLVKVVDRITEESGRSWFGTDMDNSRVDKFYWILFAIILIHLIIFRFVAAQIRIRAVDR